MSQFRRIFGPVIVTCLNLTYIGYPLRIIVTLLHLPPTAA